MDDLLIVRQSDRMPSRRRRSERSAMTLNAQLSMILGGTLGIVAGLRQASEHAAPMGLVLGMAIGLAAGNLLSRLSSRHRNCKRPRRQYDGMPRHLEGDCTDDPAAASQAM